MPYTFNPFSAQMDAVAAKYGVDESRIAYIWADWATSGLGYQPFDGNPDVYYSANEDPDIDLIVLMPTKTSGRHKILNGFGRGSAENGWFTSIALTKNLVSLFGSQSTTMEREFSGVVAFTVANNSVVIEGITVYEIDSSNMNPVTSTKVHWFLHDEPLGIVSSQIYRDIQQSLSGNPGATLFRVLGANGISFQNIASAFNFNMFQVGGASDAPTLSLWNCTVYTPGGTCLNVQNCNVMSVYNTNMVNSGTTFPLINIGALCAGTVKTISCNIAQQTNAVKIDGTAGAVYESNNDSFSQIFGTNIEAINSATVRLQNTGLNRDANNKIVDLDATSRASGSFFDKDLNQLVSLDDTLSFEEIPAIEYQNFYE